MISAPKSPSDQPIQRRHRLELGSLEIQVMEIVWEQGQSSVREVFQSMDRDLAYTTIMTTLDRLCKKGLLRRQKQGRAFLYAADLTRQEWEQERVGDLVAGFLMGPSSGRELLISCILDAVGQHDAVLLDQLEDKIREKRKLVRKGQR